MSANGKCALCAPGGVIRRSSQRVALPATLVLILIQWQQSRAGVVLSDHMLKGLRHSLSHAAYTYDERNALSYMRSLYHAGSACNSKLQGSDSESLATLPCPYIRFPEPPKCKIFTRCPLHPCCARGFIAAPLPPQLLVSRFRLVHGDNRAASPVAVLNLLRCFSLTPDYRYLLSDTHLFACTSRHAGEQGLRTLRTSMRLALAGRRNSEVRLTDTRVKPLPK